MYDAIFGAPVFVWKNMLLEKDIQKQILQYLEIKRIFHFRNNSGAVKGMYNGKARFLRFGAVGSPDIICIKGGQFIGIEVKRPGTYQSVAQKAFQTAVEEAGGRYILARSLDEIINAL